MLVALLCFLGSLNPKLILHDKVLDHLNQSSFLLALNFLNGWYVWFFERSCS
jgi:hypothetical protein